MANELDTPGSSIDARKSHRASRASSVGRWWTLQRRTGNPFLPVLLLAAALVLLVGSQTAGVLAERFNLNRAWDGQAEAFDQSKRLRRQLDGIATETARLARRGNQNAAKVVAELSKLGITIDPDAKPAPIPE